MGQGIQAYVKPIVPPVLLAVIEDEVSGKVACGSPMEVTVRAARSGADEAGVEAAGESDVRGAVDEGAAVGEEGDGVGAAAEAEQEGVRADVGEVGDGGELVLHGGEVDGAMVLVDLDGVAAAEGDVGAEGSGEVGEVAEVADLAAGARGGGGDFSVIEAGGCGGLPKFEAKKGSAQEVVLAGEDFEGFGDLQGGGKVDGGGEDAGGVAGFDGAGGWGGEDAGEAGGGGVGLGIWGRRVASLRG